MGARGTLAGLAVTATMLVAACTPDRAPEPPAPEPPAPEPAPSPPPLGASGVSAADPAAVAVGMDILAAGGNAVDAAVATAFAVSVAEPFASGIGGGGAAIVIEPGGYPAGYDYREVVADDGDLPATDTGIPGFVAGMAEVHAEHGVLDFADLVAPAVTLARDGTETSDTVADMLRGSAWRLPTGQLPHLYPGGAPLRAGDDLVQTDLADTLAEIGERGPEAFYDGDLAQGLAAAVDGIDPASLAAYEVQRSTPPSGEFAGYRVVAAAPALAGASLIQMLQVAEALGVGDQEPDSADYIHTLAMSWRLADRVLATDLGDPAFTDVPVAEMTDPDRNADLAAEIPSDGLLAAAADGSGAGRSGNTSHIAVVDADGGAVSMTNTLLNFWGSGEYHRGFFLNDQLSWFAIGDGAANRPEPGRRAAGWLIPAVVLDTEDRPVLVIGSPGGRRIPNILFQVLVRWAAHDQPLTGAVAAPRFHLEGSTLEFEDLPPDPVADDLRGRGYADLVVPEPRYYYGSVQSLEIDYAAGEVTGAVDPRRSGDYAVRRG